MSRSQPFDKDEFAIVPNKSCLRGLSPDIQTLHFWLCTYMNNENSCWPSVKTLAVDCGMSVRTVMRCLKRLCDEGLVKKVQRFDAKGLKTSNNYTVLIKKPIKELHPEPLVAVVSDASESHGYDKLTHQICQPDTLDMPHSHINSTQLTQTNELNNSTNVELVQAPKRKGPNPEVSEALAYWQEVIGYPILDKRTENRRACYTLIRRHKLDGVKKLIRLADMAQRDRFAGGGSGYISDFISLKNHTKDLYVWAKKRASEPQKGRTYKI